MRSNLNTFDKLTTIDSFSTFTRLIEGTEIETTLKSRMGFTLFAPIDRSFSSLPEKFLDKLISARHTRILMEVWRYHFVDSRFRVRELAANQFIPTEQGLDLKITSNEDVLRINDAKIVLPDIHTSDGIIHGIDELLIPGEMALVKYLCLSRSLSTNDD